MIVWAKDGCEFVNADLVKSFSIVMDSPEDYCIYADESLLGEVDSETEAKRVLINIANAYVNANTVYMAPIECDPW